MFFRKKYNIKKLSDEELVALYKDEGDTVFVGELFERYTDLAFLVSMKYLKNEEEAKDAVMQVFEKLLKDLKRYEVRVFKYWFHTVVKNQCLGRLEKQQRQRQKVDEFKESGQAVMESEIETPLLGEGDMQEMQLENLEAAISKLKNEQRTCIELFFLQQKSYKEVADTTGFSMLQVKSYIQNGKRNLKKHLVEMTGVRGQESGVRGQKTDSHN